MRVDHLIEGIQVQVARLAVFIDAKRGGGGWLCLSRALVVP
jgi:hypothetical protein